MTTLRLRLSHFVNINKNKMKKQTKHKQNTTHTMGVFTLQCMAFAPEIEIKQSPEDVRRRILRYRDDCAWMKIAEQPFEFTANRPIQTHKQQKNINF